MDDVSEGKCPFGFGGDNADASKPGYTHSAVTPALSRDQLPKLVPNPIKPGVGKLQTGRCLCGAVSYSIDKPAEKVFANHSASSRRWAGGIALTVMIKANNTTFHGWGHIVSYNTSQRENHCFCRLCGSSIFIRHLQPELMEGMISLSAGALDSLDGMKLAGETYFDCKPDLYEFKGDRKTMTEAEVDAIYDLHPSAK